MKQHSLDGKFVCKICSYKSEKATGLKLHMGVHFKSGYYPCSFCGEEFTSEELLETHFRKHEEENLELQTEKVDQDHKEQLQYEFKCATCGKEYKHWRYFQRHQCISPKFTLKCGLCVKRFDTKANLEEHMELHQLKGEKMHFCSICSKGCPSLNRLTKHYQAAHPVVRSCKCDICGKEFAKNSQLRRHKQMHNPKRAFPCNICDLRFQSRQTMESHRVSHTEASFSCDICNKSYRHQRTYHNHLRRHHDISPAMKSNSISVYW